MTPEQLRRRNYALKRRYKINVKQYLALLEAQGGKCALCGTKNPLSQYSVDVKVGSPYSFHVDHCRQSGRVRGLLCRPCNGALGTLGDTPAALERVVHYLRGDPIKIPEPGGRVWGHRRLVMTFEPGDRT